jgi:heterodisulfide reductase subunit C
LATASNGHAAATGFLAEVMAATPGKSRLDICIQCGTCGGSCPSGADMDHTPRMLFALIAADMKKEVLKSNAPWYCVSCYYCTVRCPQEIHITDIMYSLKQMAIKEGYSSESSASNAPDFSETFIQQVEKNGRSFELGLATRYHLAHHPLEMLKMASMGLGMLQKGRLDLAPKKIKRIDQLQAVLAKAKELGG